MRCTSIWFDLHVGQTNCDDKGTREYVSVGCSEQRLTAVDIEKVAQFREELHRQLDCAIDSIDRTKACNE